MPAVASSQGQDNSSALEDDFYSLKAELDELAATLPRTEHCRTSQSQLGTSPHRRHPQGFPTSSNNEAHAMLQEEPFSNSNSSRQWWYQATDPPSDSCNEPLQHAHHAQQAQHAQQNGTAQAGRAPHEDVHEFVAGMYQQQERHGQPDMTAPDAQLFSGQEYNCTERVEVGQGSKRGSRGGPSPNPGSVLGCTSVQNLPVLNSSFIVPAQPVKPKKVDRVTRYR